jgi:hypothetical protein
MNSNGGSPARRFFLPVKHQQGSFMFGSSWFPVGLFCAAFMNPAAHAAPLVLNCPATVSVAASAQAPAGWEAVPSTQPLSFNNIGLFSGHPREMASLVPDTQRRSGKQLLSAWRLPGASERYWLACSYTQTTLQITQRLPAGLTRCTATHTGPAATLHANPELRCE